MTITINNHFDGGASSLFITLFFGTLTAIAAAGIAVYAVSRRRMPPFAVAASQTQVIEAKQGASHIEAAKPTLKREKGKAVSRKPTAKKSVQRTKGNGRKPG